MCRIGTTAKSPIAIDPRISCDSDSGVERCGICELHGKRATAFGRCCRESGHRLGIDVYSDRPDDLSAGGGGKLNVIGSRVYECIGGALQLRCGTITKCPEIGGGTGWRRETYLERHATLRNTGSLCKGA